ncbi:hypothetical protein [Streptomyces sediminimaris]
MPSTPEACASDLRTKQERTAAAGAARDQFAFTGIAARGHDTRAADDPDD